MPDFYVGAHAVIGRMDLLTRDAARLIDTSVLSELRKGRRANANVVRWYMGVDDAELYLSVLVLGEVRCGIERIRTRDGQSAGAIERWLDRLTTRYASQILAVDAARRRVRDRSYPAVAAACGAGAAKGISSSTPAARAST